MGAGLMAALRTRFPQIEYIGIGGPRMLAALGHPVLRLVRTRIGPWSIEGLQPGESEVLPAEAERVLFSARA